MSTRMRLIMNELNMYQFTRYLVTLKGDHSVRTRSMHKKRLRNSEISVEK